MNTRGPHTRRFGQTEKYLRSGQKIFESLTRNIWIRDKIFDTVQTIYKMISIESWEMERMNYCRGTPVLVSAGWLHEAGAAENKDVIHGRQIICSVIHGAERGMDHLYQHCTRGQRWDFWLLVCSILVSSSGNVLFRLGLKSRWLFHPITAEYFAQLLLWLDETLKQSPHYYAWNIPWGRKCSGIREACKNMKIWF